VGGAGARIGGQGTQIYCKQQTKMAVVLEPKDLDVFVCLRVKKPVSEVFAAVQQPEIMSQYFIAASTGPLVTGNKVTWSFADFKGVKEADVIEAVTNEKIEFDYTSFGAVTRVLMTFTAAAEDITVVKIRESCAEEAPNAASVKKYGRTTYAWMIFLFSLKGFMEHGVNLRAGCVESVDWA
jgi:uncharacterized protein YndB with AHSA1/START domain